MKMVQCSKGHYYDMDLYQDGCPHCRMEAASLGGDDRTVPQNLAGQGAQDFYYRTPQVDEGVTQPVKDLTATVPLDLDEDKTTRVEFSTPSGEECGVGWLVCTKGIHFGRDFRLHSGRNFIGRSREMDVCLEGDKTVSRSAQAIVIYDPKSKRYMVQPGDSRDLFYINGDAVLESRALNARDRLEIGEETLMFVPLCGDDFDWEEEQKNNSPEEA